MNRYSHTRKAWCTGAVILLIGMMVAPALALEGDTFALTEVNFGDATITITNYGTSDVDPNGLVVCNYPDYSPVVGAPTPAPGESTVVDLGAIGIPAPSTAGEMGLYLDNNFIDPDSLVSYVEWGSAGHTRSSVGISAGVWTEGFVDTAGASGITTSVAFATSASDWSPLGAAQLPETGINAASLASIGVMFLALGSVIVGRRPLGT